MALAKKCDICGVFYEHDCTVKHNGIALAKITQQGVYSTSDVWDACPTCIAAIEECLERCKNRPVIK